MTGGLALFDINPALDQAGLARSFTAKRRLQIRDFLLPDAAATVHAVLSRTTPWGLSWQAGAEGPHALTAAEFARLGDSEKAEMRRQTYAAVRGRDYVFAYAQYPMIKAYLQGWSPGSGHDALAEHLNSEPFLTLMRAITGIPEIIKADAQATLYAPSHFLSVHNDAHSGEGRRVAYVLNMTREEWRPEWGGYLLFHDDEGDVVEGYLPRFNTLNLFLVPQKHSVSYVPPFAPVGRYAITGWLRDR